MKRYLLILLLTFNASLVVASPLKKVAADTTVDKNTLKKILHWVSAFTMYSSVDLSDKVDLGQYAEATDLLQSFVQNPELSLRLNAFRKATFVNVYPKGLLNGNEWILKKLNEIADAQYNTLNPPSLTLEVWFTPDATASRYLVTALFKTTEDKLRAAVAAANPALSSALLGKTYAQPRLAKADVNAAIFAALDALQTAIGSTFAPDIAIRYNDVMYLNNQTIEVWQKANEGITLQAVDKNNVLLTGALTWTNVVGTGNTVRFPIGKVGLERVTLKTGSEAPISLLMKVKEFNLDLNSLLKKLIIEALSAKKKKATDTLVALRQDSLRNANDIGRLITELEKNNFPLENTGASLTPLFANPITLIAKADTSIFANTNSTHAKSFAEIRKRKRIHKTMRHSINVAAVADLIVKDQSRMNTLLDDLVKNSGELIANLILGKDSKGQEDIAKSIVMDYLNKNLERITGEAANDMQADPPLPLAPPAPPAAAPTFVATKYLYISPQVQFAGKEAFVRQLEDSLKKRKTPLYAFINYSQDVSTEAYLARANGARPKGLPDGAKFITATLVNIPGSIKCQVVSSSTGVRVGGTEKIDEALWELLEGEGAMGGSSDQDDLIAYLKEKAKKLFGETQKVVYGFAYCKKCKTENTGKITDLEIGKDRTSAVLIGKDSKCFGAIAQTSLVIDAPRAFKGNNQNFNQWSETVYQGQDQILVALLNDERQYFDCSDFLKDQFSDWDYCSKDPTVETLDKIDLLLRDCLEKNGIYVENTIATIKDILSISLLPNENLKVDFDDGVNKHNLMSKGLTDPAKANYTIQIKKNVATGAWQMSLEVSIEYLRSLGLSEKEAIDLLAILEELFRQSQVKFCQGEVKPECVSEPLRFLQLLNLNLVNLTTEGTMHPVMWNTNDSKSGLVKPIFKVHPIVGGAADGLVESVTDIPVLVKTVGEIALEEEKRQAFFSLFSKEGLSQMADGIFKELVSVVTEEQKREHTVSKASVQLALAYYLLLEKTAKGIADALEKAKVLSTKIEHTPALQQYLKKIIKDAPDQAKAKKLEKLLNGVNSTDLEKLLNKVDPAKIDNLVADLSDDLALAKEIVDKPGLVDAWKRFDDAGLTALRKDPIQLQKFDDIVKNNNLGLDADGLGDLLKSPQAKGLTWDNPDKVLDAIKRSSDANVQGLSISHKKFPAPANGTDNFVLKNAKQFQAEASGDAALSFNKGGVSFDDVAADGKLVDRKYGHRASVFDKVEDDLLTVYEIKNQSRAQSILDQAQRQLNAVGGDGSKLRWEISTIDGAGGIRQLFESNGGAISGIADIEVVYVAQQVIK